MKKNKIALIERHIYLENWLQENYPVNMSDNEILNYFINNFSNKHDVEYLLEAYFLPKKEIEKEMLKEDSKGLSNIDINRLADILAKKYSTTKGKIIKRISQIMDMNKLSKKVVNEEKEKMQKPKIKWTFNNISDVIDDYIRRNKKDDLDRKVILEKLLEENYTDDKDRMINDFYMAFNEEDARYLSRSYLMPRSEIVDYIKKYDMRDSFEIEILASFLSKQYGLPKEEVILRIEEAVIINYLYNIEKSKKNKTKEKIK